MRIGVGDGAREAQARRSAVEEVAPWVQQQVGMQIALLRIGRIHIVLDHWDNNRAWPSAGSSS